MKRVESVFLFLLLCSFFSVYTNMLVDVKVIPNVIVDLKYATTDNFTGVKIYQSDDCYALDVVVEALSRVQQELESYGLGIKIFDAYRPMSAQWAFWNLIPDERYVSDPRKGGRHTRGTAVDITLVDLQTGIELEMPTPFDDFTENAWSTAEGISIQAKQNRDFLILIMHKHGFTVLPTEWWHFDYNCWEDFPIL